MAARGVLTESGAEPAGGVDAGVGAVIAELARPPRGVPAEAWERSLAAPVREVLSRPGKQFRARLTGCAYRLAGGVGQAPPGLSLAVELLHAGSLVVDDIEDGSSARRGAPTLHRLFGVPLALNAGNWLYFRALRALADAGLPPAAELRARRLTEAAVLRCHEGQALDLSARVEDLSARQVRRLAVSVSRLKTGALTALAAGLGAAAAGGRGPAFGVLVRFGCRLGVALQMQNDLCGLRAEADGAGGDDVRNGRVTWPWAWLARRPGGREFIRLQQRRRAVLTGELTASGLAAEALAALGPAGAAAVRGRLRSALALLERQFPGAPALAEFAAELTRLETRYAA